MFSFGWVARGINCVRTSRGSPIAATSMVLTFWLVTFLFVYFFTGFQYFQNFYGNAYFWLISGIVFASPYAARRSPYVHEVEARAKEAERTPAALAR